MDNKMMNYITFEENRKIEQKVSSKKSDVIGYKTINSKNEKNKWIRAIGIQNDNQNIKQN